jgi:hypothetical protein
MVNKVILKLQFVIGTLRDPRAQTKKEVMTILLKYLCWAFKYTAAIQFQSLKLQELRSCVTGDCHENFRLLILLYATIGSHVRRVPYDHSMDGRTASSYRG